MNLKLRQKIAIGFLFLVTVSCSSWTVQTESHRFHDFLEEKFEEGMRDNPEMYTYLGEKKFYGELNDYSSQHDELMLEKAKKWLTELSQFHLEDLNEESQVSYRLFKKQLEDRIADDKWRLYGYVSTQFFGFHSDLPAFLMNYHRVDDEEDLGSYLSRLAQFPRVFQQQIAKSQEAEKNEILPPQFVYPYVLTASKNIIKGFPFDKESHEKSPLYQDFMKKAEALKLSEKSLQRYDKDVRDVLLKKVRPAYLDFIAFFEKQSARAHGNTGVWKLPQGNDYYKDLVRRHTTTSISPDEIHHLGLSHVSRLQGEMREVLKQMQYKGSLQSFFEKLRRDDQYYFPNTPAGGEAYLDLSRRYYEDIQPLLPKYFRLMPKAKFEIRPVEKFRESSAGIAFYEHPSEDGKRPGVYYVNLRNMRDLPKHEAQVVLYHEGAPGHHFQIALAQELSEIPRFRKYNNYTAYSEGWGLYTERLTGEMGVFKDLESQFGKLSLEMLRASRLVLDTGIHFKKWSREKALDYMRKNVPGALEDQKNEIERYFVLPGQATAYMVGMLKIIDLRERAKKDLADRFDLRDFHDVVLKHGSLPLSELEANVDEYIKEKR